LPAETARLEGRHQLARGEHLHLDAAPGHEGDALGEALGAGAQAREILGPGGDHLELLDALGDRRRREARRGRGRSTDRSAGDELATLHPASPACWLPRDRYENS
jgi:hypothetical protein